MFTTTLFLLFILPVNVLSSTGLYPKHYPDPACNYTENATHYNPPLLYNLNQDPGELNPLDTSRSPYTEMVDAINQVIMDTDIICTKDA